jgi:hypothetical protein
VPWKTRLNQAWGKANKKPPTKTSLVYTTEAGEGGFVASLVGENLTNEYNSDKAEPSKKAAEEALAEECLKTEFPEDYAKFSAMNSGGAASGKKGKAGKAGAAAGAGAWPAMGAMTKPGKVTNSGNHAGKSLLNQALMVIAGRSLTKGEVEYTTEDVSGTTVGTVTIKFFEPEQSHQGEAVNGTGNAAKKEAENKAAEAALAAHAALYEEKKGEAEAGRAMKKEAMKAERAAAKEIAGAADEKPAKIAKTGTIKPVKKDAAPKPEPKKVGRSSK